MTQNRNNLIELFIANLSNAIIHRILEKAINIEEIANRYNKEIKNSWQIAQHYRQKINPINAQFPIKDREEIRRKIKNRVLAELKIRVEKGYENIDLSLIDSFIEDALRELVVEWIIN